MPVPAHRPPPRPAATAQRLTACSATLAAVAAATLVACGGNSDPPPPPGSGVQNQTTVLVGVVARGAAVAGATVTIADGDPGTPDITAITGPDGSYRAVITGMTGPLLATASGTLHGDAVSLHAVLPTAPASGEQTANITSITEAITALIAPGVDPAALNTPAAIAAIRAADVSSASRLVVATLRTVDEFATLLGTAFDPLATAFTANSSGIDRVLDLLRVELSSAGVTLTNLAAPVGGGGGQASVTLTPPMVADPPADTPRLPQSTPASDLPSPAEMLALARKFEPCLALPAAERVTVDANLRVTAITDTCNFAPPVWKSQGGNWMGRIGPSLRSDTFRGATVGQPTIAFTLDAPRYGGNVFQHPWCNTATCVVMEVPFVAPSGHATRNLYHLAKVDGAWNYIGNQLPYDLGAEHRVNRKQQANTALAIANPGNYFAQSRLEAVLRLITYLDSMPAADTAAIRAVVWKGPGLPAAGVVTMRSQACGTADRLAITNQEGLLTLNNSTSQQIWTTATGNEFVLDAATLEGGAIAMPVPTNNWAGTAAPANQQVRSSPFTGSATAGEVYTAEVFHFGNTSGVPDLVVPVMSSTPYERAASVSGRSWPQLDTATLDAYLRPGGTAAGSLTSTAQTLGFTQPDGGYVNFAYVYSQNRLNATNSSGESANHWKRQSLWFRPTVLGANTIPGYEWSPVASGTSMSDSTATSGTNPNPRCTGNELVPLEGVSTNSSYREVGLHYRGTDRKLYVQQHFWSN